MGWRTEPYGPVVTSAPPSTGLGNAVRFLPNARIPQVPNTPPTTSSKRPAPRSHAGKVTGGMRGARRMIRNKIIWRNTQPSPRLPIDPSLQQGCRLHVEQPEQFAFAG